MPKNSLCRLTSHGPAVVTLLFLSACAHSAGPSSGSSASPPPTLAELMRAGGTVWWVTDAAAFVPGAAGSASAAACDTWRFELCDPKTDEECSVHGEGAVSGSVSSQIRRPGTRASVSYRFTFDGKERLLLFGPTVQVEGTAKMEIGLCAEEAVLKESASKSFVLGEWRWFRTLEACEDARRMDPRLASVSPCAPAAKVGSLGERRPTARLAKQPCEGW